MNRGETYTLMIQVHTMYGTGKWAQTTAETYSQVGQVTGLKSRKDSHNLNFVYLTWGPPANTELPILVSNID